MTPLTFFNDPQVAVRHQHDLRAAAAQARFARSAIRTFAFDRSDLPSARRWALRYSTEGSRA